MTRPLSYLLAPLLVLATLLLAAPATAQVRNAPAGNDLPATPTPVDPHALSEVADPHASHDHAPGEHHDHAPHAAADVMSRAEHAAFAEAVDLSDVRDLAVFDGGRVKILETLAGEQINRIYGKPRWRDLETGRTYDPVFTYLDLLFNKPYYFDKPMVYVEVLPLRRELVAHLPAAERDTWLRHGRLSPLMLASPQAQQILGGMNADLRLFKAQQAVVGAAMAFDQLGQRMLMVSPQPGSDQWTHVLALGDPRVAAADGQTGLAALPVSSPELARTVSEQFDRLATAWRQGDAAVVNQALDALTDAIPNLNPQTYPSPTRLSLESIYNATHRFTIGYVAYLAGAIVLLLAFAVARRPVIGIGVALLGVGFIVHTAGMIVRGVLSERWPIHNQFESFVAITWFAVGVGIVLMVLRRQWLFGAASAALGACALFVANTMDIPSNEVGRVAGILATSNILYIHVNMVLVSYALIALGFFISLFYLGVHYAEGGAAVRMAAAGLGQVDESDGTPTRGRQALLNDLDKAQMVVLQLAFWLLGTGILLGAYWADHAWGRWWGWDPKETWALLTWIVYLVAIHVRFGVRRRGLVTAWLSIAGFAVMCFCYWGVNMLLPGLHSYA